MLDQLFRALADFWNKLLLTAVVGFVSILVGTFFVLFMSDMFKFYPRFFWFVIYTVCIVGGAIALVAITRNVYEGIERRLRERKLAKLKAEEVIVLPMPTTPVSDFVPFPFAFPDAPRYEGAWMVAYSGAGKTTALLSLILKDIFEKVAKDEATVVVMDSQGNAKGSLLYSLSRHVEFAGSLKGKLILLEPDPDHPLALNIFDMGEDRTSRLSGLDREIALNTTEEMLQFILGGLLGSELTKKQGGVFRYLVQALMHIPNATIFTLAQLLDDKGYEQHRKHILTMDEFTRDFFEKQFRALPRTKNQFAATKGELLWRIHAILSDLTFRRMFSHPKNKLDLYTELQSSKVILINTNRALLKAARVETFGRYFIAAILQAVEQRGLIDKSERKPVFIYLDEAHEYIANEPKIAVLLETVARKNNVAFFFAHQRVDQIKNADVEGALANCAIQFVGRTPRDVGYFSKLMNVLPENISSLPQGDFIAQVRYPWGTWRERVSFPKRDSVPFMSAEEFYAIKQDMWRRFSAPPINVSLPAPVYDDEETTKPGRGEHLE